MRLIDADKIPVVSWDPIEEEAFRHTIAEQPTVDAIPVEWINRWYDRNYKYVDIEISDLLNDWKEVQKEGNCE
jgi:hypothetical protein